MLLGIIAVMAASTLLFIVGMFVPASWESAVMGLSMLLGAAALAVLTAAWAVGYQLTI